MVLALAGYIPVARHAPVALQSNHAFSSTLRFSMNNLRRACHRVNSRNAAISGVDNYKVGLNPLVFALTPFIGLNPLVFTLTPFIL
jgi:hypothetical protein